MQLPTLYGSPETGLPEPEILYKYEGDYWAIDVAGDWLTLYFLYACEYGDADRCFDKDEFKEFFEHIVKAAQKLGWLE